MWPHFVNLLSASWLRLLSALGTTTLAIVLFSLAVPIATFIVTMCTVGRSAGGVMEHIRKSAIPTLIGLLVPCAFISVVFLCCIVKSVYDDHEVLAAKATTPPPRCPTCPTCPACPAYPAKIYNTGIPSHYQDAPEGRALFITTNHTVEAPFRVNVKCQVPIIKGGSDFWTVQEGNFISQKSDRVKDGAFESLISGPSFTPSLAMIVTIFAKERLGHCVTKVN
jgi:hypothetical protein